MLEEYTTTSALGTRVRACTTTVREGRQHHAAKKTTLCKVQDTDSHMSIDEHRTFSFISGGKEPEY